MNFVALGASVVSRVSPRRQNLSLSINLSLGQTESQVDENLRLLATPFGQALRALALALTLVEIKFARKSTLVFHRLATPTQVNAS